MTVTIKCINCEIPLIIKGEKTIDFGNLHYYDIYVEPHKCEQSNDSEDWKFKFENMAANWQEEHNERIKLEERLKWAEMRIHDLRATIMDEIEDDEAHPTG